MKKIFSTVTFLVFTVCSIAQTNCDIKEHYEDFIFVRKENYNGKVFLIVMNKETDKKNCFTNIVNNKLYIDYLLKNYSTAPNYDDYDKIQDSITLQKEFIKNLKEDTTFNSVMTDLISKTAEKSKMKDSISMNKLLDIAVKFFAIYKLNDQGRYIGKVCVGMNLIKQTEKVKMPQVEAFCFTAIFNNYQGEVFDLHNEFVNAMKELYKINLGTDNNEKLLRAQGAMFFLMRNNEILKKVLISEYEKNKENLPFILKEM
jgi:hypothetical protein